MTPILSDLNWSTLLGKIKSGECTPFLGAGAAAGVLPVGDDLAEELLSEHAKDDKDVVCPLPDRANLQAVTQYIAVRRTDNKWAKQKIKEKILGCPPPDSSQPGEPHAVLARLPLPIYLTTNYDAFLFKALKTENANVEREFSRWTPDLLQRKSLFDGGYWPSVERPVVFHIHGVAEYKLGNLDDRLYQSIVVSEDDYVDFLVSLSSDLANTPTRSMLPIPIRTALRSTSLLFIGYSLKDINFRVLLRGLLGPRPPSDQHLSLTVQYEDDSLSDLKRYLIEYFHHSFKLNFVNAPATDFCTELEKRCREKGIGRATTSKAP
jgi:SIR2-like domain